MLKRFEVTFDNGKFVAFPHAKEETIVVKDNFIAFEFSGGHVASINKDHILFTEEMDEED